MSQEMLNGPTLWLAVQFPANWNQAEVSMTGTANLRVSLTPPAFSVKIISPISAICKFNTPLVQSPLFYRFGIDYESPTRLKGLFGQKSSR